jgi:hypothetical protein
MMELQGNTAGTYRAPRRLSQTLGRSDEMGQSIPKRGGQAVVQLIIGAALFVTGCGDPFDDELFSREAWAAAAAEQRAAMAEDLVTHHVSPGMSVKQTVALLGNPEDTWGKGTGHRVMGEKTFAYSIGSWSLEGMDDAFVCIHFDESGRVIEAEIYGF